MTGVSKMSGEAESAPAEAIARGLVDRMRDLVLAERRLADFAFSEKTSPPKREGTTIKWDEMAISTLVVACNPVSYKVLRRMVRDGDCSLEEIGEVAGTGWIAAVDRINTLAQAGYVRRDLERERVRATELAVGFVKLVEEIAAEAARSAPEEMT